MVLANPSLSWTCRLTLDFKACKLYLFVSLGHVYKYEAVLWTLKKLRKTIFWYKMIMVQNDQFVTKRVEIFRKHISVILKGLYWEKFNKYICYREIMRN